MRRVLGYALVLTSLMACSWAIADSCDCFCSHCGQRGRCEKVCRLECGEKEVEVFCWGCKCEDFCVPGPSQPNCQYCEMICGNCDGPVKPDAPYSKPKKFVWNTWIPGCAEVHTRKKLMRKAVVKKVPSYKWTVEDLCPHCYAAAQRTRVQPGTELPPVPAVDAEVLVEEVAAQSAPARF